MLLRRAFFFLMVFLTGHFSFAQPLFAKYLDLQGIAGLLTPRDAVPLKNQTGYLMFGDHYLNNVRRTALLRMDSGLGGVWARKLQFSTPPFDNTTFTELLETPSGNYCLVGMAATFSPARVYYVVVLLDTSGTLLQHTVLNYAASTSLTALGPHLHAMRDSSLVISVTETERFGFYRFDENLNLLSSGFYKINPGDPYASGYEALPLNDTTLLLTGSGGNGFALAKVQRSGAVVWSKSFPNLSLSGFMAYEALSGDLFVGGSSSGSGPSLAKFDASGNLLWHHVYTDGSGAWNMAYIKHIYPLGGNNLLLYSDTGLIPVDGSGLPFTGAYSLYSGNLSLSHLHQLPQQRFFWFGTLYVSPPAGWPHTGIAFDSTFAFSCFFQRPVTAGNPGSTNTFVTTITPQPSTINVQTLSYVFDTLGQGYDVFPACSLTTEIDEAEITSLSAWPVPADAFLHLDLPEDLRGKKMQVTLLDLQGRIVLAQAVSSEKISLSTAALAEGSYVLRLEAEGQAIAQRKISVLH